MNSSGGKGDRQRFAMASKAYQGAVPTSAYRAFAVERRTHVRLPLALPAEFQVHGGEETRAAIIRNFCPGGLLLAIDGIEGESLTLNGHKVVPHDRARIRLAGAEGGVHRTFSFEARVAWIINGSMGVALQDPSVDALKLLHHKAFEWELAHLSTATSQTVGGSTLSTTAPERSQNSNLTEVCTEKTSTFLESRMTPLFDKACEDLLAWARQAPNDRAERECFDAVQEVREFTKPIQSEFLRAVRQQIDAAWSAELLPGGLPPKAGESELALVDTQSLDDWLTITAIVARIGPRLSDQEYSVQQRLSALLRRDIGVDTNPIGLQSLCFAFHEAVQNLGATARARRAIFRGFETVIAENLGELYDGINQALAAGGVLPVLPLQRQKRIARTPKHQEATDPPVLGHDAAGAVGQDRHRVPSPRPPGEGHRVSGQATPDLRGHDPARSAAASAADISASRLPFGAITGAPTEVYDTVRALVAFHHLFAGRRSKAEPVTAQAATGAPSASVAQPLLLSELARIQEEGQADCGQTGPLVIGTRLRRELAARGIEPTPSASDTMEVVSGLLDAILQDPLVSTAIKMRLRSLALPLVRVALSDPECLTSEAHPVRQVLDRLGSIELSSASERTASNSSFAAVIDTMVRDIGETRESLVEAFAQAIPALDASLVRQREVFDHKVTALARAREQQGAWVQARRKEVARNPGGHPTTAPHQPALSEEWRRWLERAARFNAGDQVVLDAASTKARQGILAWTDDERETFIFVDPSGDKVASLTRQELAMGLRRRSIQPAAEATMPVVERGMHRMLQALHTRLEHEATHDPLTGLVSAKQFRARVEVVLRSASVASGGNFFGLLAIDHFRQITVRFGQRPARTLLAQFARVLERQVGSQGLVSRLAKERFAVLLEDSTRERVWQLAERLRRSLELSRCTYEGDSMPVSVSIGIIPVTPEAQTVDALLQTAASAHATAVQAGGNRTHFAEASKRPPHKATPAGRRSVVNLIAEGRLALRCQRVEPISTDVGSKPYYEILLGVRQPDGTVGGPGSVVKTAERDGEVATLDRWVVQEALAWMAAHPPKLAEVLGFAINLSGVTLSDDGLIAFFQRQLSETRVSPGKLILEVTETAAIDSLSAAQDFIGALRGYGCRFSLDDFGAGHASFSYLKTLPFDTVKIDGLFVKDIVSNPADYAMVKSINDVAHFLGKKTVAEYVENREILGQLGGLGVDYAQGYGIEQPIPLSELQ